MTQQHGRLLAGLTNTRGPIRLFQMLFQMNFRSGTASGTEKTFVYDIFFFIYICWFQMFQIKGGSFY